jgi:putative oxidoreductase
VAANDLKFKTVTNMKTFFSSHPLHGWQYGIALVRIMVGVLLVKHGWETFEPEKMTLYTGWFVERNYPSPAAWAYAGKIAELLAGIGFVLGLFTRLAAIACISAFAGIIFILGDKGKIFQGDQHPFLFILFGFVFLFAGGGPSSLDALIFKKR